MGLHIYKGKENLPNDMEYVYDINAFFFGVKLPDCEFVRRVLKEIDEAEYETETTYKDRTGKYLYNDTLSSGSKILLAMYLYPEIVFNGIEAGANCWDLMLLCSNSHVDLSYTDVSFCVEITEPVEVNNEVFNDTYSLNESLGFMEV